MKTPKLGDGEDLWAENLWSALLTRDMSGLHPRGLRQGAVGACLSRRRLDNGRRVRYFGDDFMVSSLHSGFANWC
ncbi:MAG: hypothetical protein ACRD1O_08760, partial [Terriglobia bacterium]